MTELAAELEQLRVYADPALLPYGGDGPLGSAAMRCIPEDFQVAEYTGLQLSGSGEHLYLRVRKCGQNTIWVAKRLAELAGVPYRAVSYAGMKDRNAVTQQWFSLHLPGRADPDWQLPPAAGFEVLEAVRHDQKLRPGQLSYNAFTLRLRHCRLKAPALLEQRVQSIATLGVPNYFGQQRFGHAQGNLFIVRKAADLRSIGREQRAFALSALRGALFNGYLASRVAAGNWGMNIAGDTLISDRARGVADEDKSVFTATRLATGLLWGKQKAGQSMAEHEQAFYSQFPAVCALLEQAGSRASRRVLCARVGQLSFSQLSQEPLHQEPLHQEPLYQEQLHQEPLNKEQPEYQISGDQIALQFALGPGSYATMVLREIFQVSDQALAGVTV